jgi:anti-anti-sigma factor
MEAMVLSLAGEWDISRSDELRACLEPTFQEPYVVYDLTSAKYVTSTLICALVVAHKRRSAAKLPPAAIAVKSAFVRRLLEATGLEALFPVYETVEETLSSYRPATPSGDPNPVIGL